MSEPLRTPNASQGQAHWGHIDSRTGEIFNVRPAIARQRTQMPACIDRLGNILARSALLFPFELVIDSRRPAI